MTALAKRSSSILMAIALCFSTGPAKSDIHNLQGNGTTAAIADQLILLPLGEQIEPGLFIWQLDFGGEPPNPGQVFQQWFWYRVGLAGWEQSIDELTLDDAAVTGNNVLDLVYSSSQFTIGVTFELTGGGVGSGVAEMAETITITNLTNMPLDFHLFAYSDFDIDDTASDDRITISETGDVATQSDASGTTMTETVMTETVISPIPSHHGIGFFEEADDILESLEDGQPTSLNGNSTGTGDVHYAFQWDLTIPASDIITIYKVKHLGLAADLDGQDDVDGSDLAAFAAGVGQTGCDQNCLGDLNGDFERDSRDVEIFARQFGRAADF